MAQGDPIPGTFTTQQTVGIREDLAGFIERIDPEDTPFYSNANKGEAKGIQTDWQIQELRDPDGNNAQKEGFEANFSNAKPTDRLSNVCQLVADTYITSDTQDAVDHAGISDEHAYQKLLTGLEVRRDLEVILMKNQTKRLSPEPRLMAGYPVMAGIKSTAAGISVENPEGDTLLVTSGTDRELDNLDMIDDVMERAYDVGGRPKVLHMRPGLKRAFSKINPDTAQVTRTTADQGEVAPLAYIGSVGIYLSDFGRIEVGMNRLMPADMIFALDFDYIDVLNLPGRAWKDTPLAKTGSSKKGMIEWEGTLRVRAPKAEGVIADVVKPNPLG